MVWRCCSRSGAASLEHLDVVGAVACVVCLPAPCRRASGGLRGRPDGGQDEHVHGGELPPGWRVCGQGGGSFFVGSQNTCWSILRRLVRCGPPSRLSARGTPASLTSKTSAQTQKQTRTSDRAEGRSPPRSSQQRGRQLPSWPPFPDRGRLRGKAAGLARGRSVGEGPRKQNTQGRDGSA
jgi:hypothetical protein